MTSNNFTSFYKFLETFESAMNRIEIYIWWCIANFVLYLSERTAPKIKSITGKIDINNFCFFQFIVDGRGNGFSNIFYLTCSLYRQQQLDRWPVRIGFIVFFPILFPLSFAVLVLFTFIGLGHLVITQPNRFGGGGSGEGMVDLDDGGE